MNTPKRWVTYFGLCPKHRLPSILEWPFSGWMMGMRPTSR